MLFWLNVFLENNQQQVVVFHQQDSIFWNQNRLLLFERDGLDCSKFDDVVAADRVRKPVLVVKVFFFVLVWAFTVVLTSDKNLLFSTHEGKTRRVGIICTDLEGAVAVDAEEVSRFVAGTHDAFGDAGSPRHSSVRDVETMFLQSAQAADHNRIWIRTVAPEGFGPDKDLAFLAGELRNKKIG